MGPKRLSPAAIVALRKALCSIYWYKADLRRFLTNCLANSVLLSSLNWDNYKRQIVSDLVDTCWFAAKFEPKPTVSCIEN